MHDDDVQRVVHGHLQWWKSQEPEQELFEDAYETQFWARQQFSQGRFERIINPTGVDEELPVKLEANRLWRWVKTHTSHLFLRAPRTHARLPGVVSGKWPTDDELENLPALVEALVDEWLDRSDTQSQATYGYQLALMGGAAAFKIGVRPGKGNVLDRVWMRVCPRWECVWDDRAANPMEQLFIGHLSWMLDIRAEQLLGELPENYPRASLPGLYTDDTRTARSAGEEQIHPDRYVRVLEFYDFEAEEQRFYLVEPNATEGPNVRPYGKPERIPYTWPNAQPAAPIFPIVLDNTPKWPMRGIPSARRIYRHVAEDNLLGSLVASRVRRSFAALGHFDPNMLDDDFGTAWAQAKDMKLVKRKASGSAQDAVTWMTPPPMDPSLDKALTWITNARLDSEATSPQMSGAQSKYATASEVEYQNQGAEASSNEIASRMVGALQGAAQMLLVIVAAETSSIEVRRGSVRGKLTRAHLRMPWHLTISDAGTTPAREASRRKDWALALPLLKELVALAYPLPPPPGQPPASTPQMERFARLAIDETVQVYNLSDRFQADSIDGVGEDEEDDAEDMQAPLPDLASLAAALPSPSPMGAVPGAPMADPAAVAPPGMPPVPAPPGAPPPLPALPPSSGVVVDPVTGMVFDAATGAVLDPMTGQPILPGTA